MIKDIPTLLILQYIHHFMPPLIAYKRSEELIQPKNHMWDPNFNNTYSQICIFRRHTDYILYEYGAN